MAGIYDIFAEKMWVAHFFTKNICELAIVLTRTVNILTTNEHVKLTMLWTAGPRYQLWDHEFKGSNPAGGEMQAHDCTALHCTERFIIVLP